MITKVYYGYWKSELHAFALTESEVINLIVSCFAFGDPETDEYALGRCWGSEGWNVVSKFTEVDVIETQIYKSLPGDTSHVVWTCPICKQTFSDDLLEQEQVPTLLTCMCNGRVSHFRPQELL